MVTDELQINITANTGNAASNIQNTANALNTLGDSAKTADTDMSELVRAMSEAAANMVSVSQNISASAAGLTSFQSNIDAVSTSLQGVNTYFDALNTHLQQSYTAFDGAATSVTSLSAASEQSANALNNIVTATDGFADRMDALSDTTHGTTVGMVSLQKEILDTLTSMRGFADSMGTAGKEAEETSRKIRNLVDDVENLAKSSKNGNTAVISLAAGFKTLKGVVATLGIAKFIKESNDAYNVQMQNELKLTAHMKQRMNATDDEVQSIKDLAAAQQQLGVIGDEIQLAGAQQLTTYAKQTSTLKTLLPAMNNLIAQNAGYEASVGDATSAADMLGRALNGQYTSLKRMGVTFTEAQEQVLKYGTETQKASVLAQAINDKVGNMNELLAQTPTGKMKQLENEFGDLKEEIGATFQPLISSLVPVLSGVMDALAEPIKNVSRGIVLIGKAIASIDSPAVRAIGLAAAGIAIMYKLKNMIGATSAGLLVLGVVLSGIIGSMSQEQDSISDIVNTAYDTATAGANKASEAAENYDETLQNVQKTASKLAGFDTITKLSGNSSSNILASQFGDINDWYDYANAAADINDALSGLSDDLTLHVDWNGAAEQAGKFLSDVDFLFKHWGDDEAMYQPLTRMTDKIKDILDAAGFDGQGITDFFKGVGSDLYDAFEGDEVKGWSALTKRVQDFLNHVNLDGNGFINFWKKIGDQIGEAFNGFFAAWDAWSKGEYDTAMDLGSHSVEAIGGITEWVGTVTGATNLQRTGEMLNAGVDAYRRYQNGEITENQYKTEIADNAQKNIEDTIVDLLTNQYHNPLQNVTALEKETASLQNKKTLYTDVPLTARTENAPIKQGYYSTYGMPSNVIDNNGDKINIYIDGVKQEHQDIEVNAGK